MDYTIKLSSFEGPLDLLLFLIRKNELDIYDIPISIVVEQYVEYLSDIHELSIDKAGEYLLMLATLLRIKSRMLLPGEESDEEEAGEDPREDLVQKLIEYQKFKEIADDLGEKARSRSLLFGRGTESVPADEHDEDLTVLDIELDSLLDAFRQAMQRFSDQEPFIPRMAEFTIEDKMQVLLDHLESTTPIDLEELFATCRSKIELIVVFLALLELMRLRKLMVSQQDSFGKLAVHRMTEFEGETAAPGEAGD